MVAEAEEQLGAEGLAAATWIIVTINAWNRVAIASHSAGRALRAGRVSAAALRALHVAGDPLILANAWDAGTARLVEQAGFAAVATTSSGVADALGYEDGEQTPVEEMLAAVARVARAVELPVTADMEAGYGLDGAELAQRVAATGAVGLNLEDTDHATPPGARAGRAARGADRARQGSAPTSCSTPASTSTCAAAATAEALERARAYRDAGADCVYPIGVADEATIERVRGARDAGQHPAAARARRRSSGWPSWASPASASATYLHAEMMEALAQPPRRACRRADASRGRRS